MSASIISTRVRRPRWTVPPRAERARSFSLWPWFPREILRRGGTVTRDDERAYCDLRAAQDRAEW